MPQCDGDADLDFPGPQVKVPRDEAYSASWFRNSNGPLEPQHGMFTVTVLWRHNRVLKCKRDAVALCGEA